jgi:hypothetical protein
VREIPNVTLDKGFYSVGACRPVVRVSFFRIVAARGLGRQECPQVRRSGRLPPFSWGVNRLAAHLPNATSCPVDVRDFCGLGAARSCFVDTLAMVMVYEALREWIEA